MSEGNTTPGRNRPPAGPLSTAVEGGTFGAMGTATAAYVATTGDPALGALIGTAITVFGGFFSRIGRNRGWWR